MSDEPQKPPDPVAPPQLQIPRAPQPMPIKCWHCKKDMTVMLPAPRVFNEIDVSSIIFIHNRPDTCPHCKTMFLPRLDGFDEHGGILFKWIPVSVSGGRAPVIVGGTPNELKNAIENANVAEQIRRSGKA